MKKALCSSPLLERIVHSEFTSQPPAASTTHVPEQKTGSLLFKKPRLLSDPINSSPPTSPSKRPDAEKPPALDIQQSKEWRNANKVMRKRQDILKEMVLELALCINDEISTDYFRSVFETPIVRNTYLEIPLISWKRRVSAKYNVEEDVFVPCEHTEVSERILALYYSPAVLLAKMKDDSLALDIDKALRRARAESPQLKYHLFVLVQGLREHLRKLQATEDKQYRENLLLQLQEALSKKRKHEELTVTAAEAQALIVETEVKWGINIFVAKSMDELTDWLHAFTYTIGNSLYDKFERNPQLAGIGSVRLGKDKRTTFLEMIKKFSLMTTPRAEKLYQFYGSPLSLYKRFMEHEDVGTAGGKNILPPSVNAAMKRVFTATDCNQVITG